MGGQGAARGSGSIKRVEVRVRGGGTMVPGSVQNTRQNLGGVPVPLIVTQCQSKSNMNVMFIKTQDHKDILVTISDNNI